MERTDNRKVMQYDLTLIFLRHDSRRVAGEDGKRISMNNILTDLMPSVGLGLAASGNRNPMLAAFMQVPPELAFILNSTRLLPRRRLTHR